MPTASPPAAWSQVTLGPLTAAGAPAAALGLAPVEALRSSLAARLGRGEVTLSASAVRATLVREPRGGHIGIAARFLLSRGEEKLELPLEQVLGWRLNDAEQSARLYGRVVSDLCDQLLVHPRALAFLGTAAPERPLDSSLAARAQDLGPMMLLPAQEGGAEARGRIQWGSRESSGALRGSWLGNGSMRGGAVDYVARAVDLPLGLGVRGGAGLIALDVRDDYNPLVGARAQLEGELGLFGTGVDAAGQVIEPGIDMVLSPRAAFAFLLGGGRVGTPRALTSWELGVAPRLEAPFGPYIGLTAGAFVGVARTAMKSPPPVRGNSGFDFAWYPFGSLFVQTPRARVHAGLSFSPMLEQLGTLRGDGGGSVFDGPQITLTYEERTGRGMGRRHVEPPGNVAALATPANPFLLAARARIPSAAAPTPAPEAAAAPTVATAPAATGLRDARRWAVLEPRISGALEPQTGAVARKAIADELGRAGMTPLPAGEVSDVLVVSGMPQPEVDALPNVAGALSVDAVLLVDISLDETGVHYRIHAHHTAAGETTTLDGHTSRAALLRELRARVGELLR